MTKLGRITGSGDQVRRQNVNLVMSKQLPESIQVLPERTWLPNPRPGVPLVLHILMFSLPFSKLIRVNNHLQPLLVVASEFLSLALQH